MDQIETNQGVPLPAVKRSRPSKYPFETMAVGEFFFVPGQHPNTMVVRASVEGKRWGRKFRTRVVHMRETIEGWKICEPEDELATKGVGVWRDA